LKSQSHGGDLLLKHSSLLLGDLLNSLLNSLNSSLQVLLLSFIGGKLRLVLGDLSSVSGYFFLMLDLLLLVLNSLRFIRCFRLLVLSLLLNDISGLNTLSDESDSFFLGTLCLFFGILDL